MILLTGASGFIGKNLHQKLLDEGVEVYALARGKTEHQTHAVDLNDKQSLESIPWQKISKVVHLAAAGVKAGGRDWQACVEVNIIGLLNLLPHISEHSLPLIIGKTFYEDYLNEFSALKQNPYILTKSASSQAVELFSRTHPEGVVLVNIFQCYGAGDDEDNVLNYAVMCFRDKQLAKFGPCQSERDWVYIDDVVELFYALSIQQQSTGLHNVDAGTGVRYRVAEVIEMIAQITEAKQYMEFAPANDRGDQDVVAQAQHFLPGWKAKVSLDQGIERLIKSYINE